MGIAGLYPAFPPLKCSKTTGFPTPLDSFSLNLFLLSREGHLPSLELSPHLLASSKVVLRRVLPGRTGLIRSAHIIFIFYSVVGGTSPKPPPINRLCSAGHSQAVEALFLSRTLVPRVLLRHISFLKVKCNGGLHPLNPRLA